MTAIHLVDKLLNYSSTIGNMSSKIDFEEKQDGGMCYGTPNDLYSAHLQGTDPDSRYLPYSFILSMRGYNN